MNYNNNHRRVRKENLNWIFRDGKYRVDEGCNSEKNTGYQHNNNDYVEEVDILLFYGYMGIEEFLDWKVDIDKFFDVMKVPENMQVRMVVVRLKGVERIVLHRRRQENGLVKI